MGVDSLAAAPCSEATLVERSGRPDEVPESGLLLATALGVRFPEDYNAQMGNPLVLERPVVGQKILVSLGADEVPGMVRTGTRR